MTPFGSCGEVVIFVIIIQQNSTGRAATKNSSGSWGRGLACPGGCPGRRKSPLRRGALVLIATTRKSRVVRVAGVLRVLSFSALDLGGDVWSVSWERGQTNILSILLQGKGETTSEEKNHRTEVDQLRPRILTAGACFSAVKGRRPSSMHTGTTVVYAGMMTHRSSKSRSSG